jgi:hypothetical protein
VKKAKRYHEKRNARIQDHPGDIGANPGRTGSIDQMILLAAVQKKKSVQERWEAVQASKTPRRLRMLDCMTKRETVGSHFQAIRNKVKKDKSVIMLYGNGGFPPSSKEENKVSTGSMKRHFLTRSTGEYRTSRGCPLCQKNNLVPVMADGRVQASDTSLDWRSCIACNIAGEAGRGEGTSRRVMQKDKSAAMNTRRGGTAQMKNKKRPCDLQNAKSSL